MGVLSRINDIIRSNLNDLISKAENPEKLLSQAIIDMESHIRKARKQVLDTIAAEKQMEKKRAVVLDSAERWERRAALALKSEDEDLARQALLRKTEHKRQAQTLDEQIRTQREYVGALKQSLVALEERLRDAQARKDALIFRAQAARTRKKVTKSISNMNTSKRSAESRAFDTFDRMEDKVLALEAQAEALLEMSDSEEFSHENSVLDGRFAGIEKEQELENQLLELKEKMAKDQTQGSEPNAKSD